MIDPVDECTHEPAAELPYIIVELPLECGHSMRVFWRPEEPCDLELHHGEQGECRTFIYDVSDMTHRARVLVAHPDVQKWITSVCGRESPGDVAQSA